MAIRLNGSTSGYTEIDAAAVAGSGLLTLPTATGTLTTAAEVAATYLPTATAASTYLSTATAAATYLPIASAGLRLITPTSIANSGGSASVSGGAVTFTGVNSISLNGCFTSAYSNYSVVCTFTASTGVNPRIRLRASGSDATSGYFSRTFLFGSATSSTNETTFFAIGDSRTAMNGFTGQILGPNLSANSVLTSHHTDSNGSSVAINLQSGYIADTTQYDGFTFFPNTGTVTGTIRCYGYQN
jgi:hypothetical protein